MSAFKGMILAGLLWRRGRLFWLRISGENQFAGLCQFVGRRRGQTDARLGTPPLPGRPRPRRGPLALGTCVHRQMTVKEISDVFGEDGVRVHDDTWLKKGNGYREDDTVCRWGPIKTAATSTWSSATDI